MKKAILSRHIVCFSSNNPIYGLILIVNGVIAEVVQADPSVPIPVLVEKYTDYSVEVLEDYYISPGIIDLNSRYE